MGPSSRWTHRKADDGGIPGRRSTERTQRGAAWAAEICAGSLAQGTNSDDEALRARPYPGGDSGRACRPRLGWQPAFYCPMLSACRSSTGVVGSS